MSDLLRWISPKDPRGITVLGSLAVAVLSYGLAKVTGTLEEVWPNRCSLIQSQLMQPAQAVGSRIAQIDVTATSVTSLSQAPHPLWNISLEHGRSIPLPALNYQYAIVKALPLSPIWIELFTGGAHRVIGFYQPSKREDALFHYVVGEPLENYPRLSKSVLLDTDHLLKTGLEVTPSEITCDRESVKTELPKVLALMLKTAEEGLTDAWLLDDTSWLTQHHLGDRVQMRLQTQVSQPERGLWRWIWTSHPNENAPTPSSPPAWLSTLLMKVDRERRALEQPARLWGNPKPYRFDADSLNGKQILHHDKDPATQEEDP